MKLEYGQWATHKGQRYMIIDWTENTVTLYRFEAGRFAVLREEIAEVSDYYTP